MNRRNFEWITCGDSVTVLRSPPPNVKSTIRDTLWLTNLVWKITGFWFSYKLMARHSWVQKLHISLTIFCAGLLLAIVSSLLGLWRFCLREKDMSYVHIVSQSIVAMQFVFASYFLLHLQFSNPLRRFARKINTTSLGIGIIKAKSSLIKSQTIVLASHGMLATCWVTYFACFYATTSEPLWPSKDQTMQPKPFHYSTMNPVILYAVAHAAVGWTVAKTLAFVHYLFVAAELRCLNEDLRSNENCWQVSVVKHYFAIHGKLVIANTMLNQGFASLHFVTIVLDTSLMCVNFYALISAYDSLKTADAVFISATLLITLTQLTAMVVLSTILRNKGRLIFDHLHHVSTLGHHWEQECFAVTTFYEGTFRRSPLTISVSNFLPITFSGIAKILSMLMAAVCLLRVVVVMNEVP